ncbi:hypothetical protein Tco_0314650, partial [Tanacetum coccineum]
IVVAAPLPVLIILFWIMKLSILMTIILKKRVVAVPLLTNRSDFYHEEFADELAHIISPSEYDHFCFKFEPELGNLTMDVVDDIFPTREPRVHVPNVLPTHPTLNLDFILLSEPLFAYIVWIFLPFLTYPLLHHIFSPVGTMIPFLTPASPFIILLCLMYLIEVELS